MGHLSPFTEPSADRYNSALFGRLLLTGDDCFENLGEKRAAMEFFLGFSLEIEEGVAGAGPNDDGVSMVVAAEGGVTGVNSDENESCRSFLSRE